MDIKFSSKYLNFEALSLITNSTQPDFEYDGVLLLTSFGTIIGKLKTHLQDNTDNPLVAKIVADAKQKLISAMEETPDSKVELISDGSMITIENCIIKGANNNTFKFDQLTIFSDQVIGFSLINIDKTLNQLP